MTEKKVTVSVVKDVFVAFDGREFYNIQECMMYESAILEARGKEIADRLPQFSFTPEWAGSDVGWEWYFVSCKEELDAVRAFLYCEDAYAHEYEPPTYPCWLAFSVEGDGYGCVEGTPEQVFSSLDAFRAGVAEMIKKFGDGDTTKEFVREIEPGVQLYRDRKTGIAWAEDHRTGLGVSVHPNIDKSGSVEGMVARGFWRRDDRTIESHGWIYNIDRLAYNDEDEVEKAVADECRCQACRERRDARRSVSEDSRGKKILDAILSALPPEPRSYDPDDDPGFWTDGEDILCSSEAEREIIADFLEDIFSEISTIVVKTGFYDPEDDAASGERDRFTGFHYISFD